jgi:hypothetical protein
MPTGNESFFETMAALKWIIENESGSYRQDREAQTLDQ